MDTREILNQAHDAMSVKRVFGEPIEKDGVTLVPVAMIIGGGGGGGGRTTENDRGGEGSGGGYGGIMRPVGAYVIKGDKATWKPAIDITGIIVGGELVTIVLFLTIRAIVRIVARRRMVAP